MNLERVAIDELVEDPENRREHNPRNLETIRRSLERFGQQKPIVVGPGNVVKAGNGTLVVARELGWTEIVIVRSDLEGEELDAFAIADNRSAELAGWERRSLGEFLASIREDDEDLVEAAGFSTSELDDLLASIRPPDPPDAFSDPEATMTIDYECPRCHHRWSGKARPVKT